MRRFLVSIVPFLNSLLHSLSTPSLCFTSNLFPSSFFPSQSLLSLSLLSFSSFPLSLSKSFSYLLYLSWPQPLTICSTIALLNVFVFVAVPLVVPLVVVVGLLNDPALVCSAQTCWLMSVHVLFCLAGKHFFRFAMRQSNKQLPSRQTS